MTDEPRDHLNLLAPRSMRPKFDYLHREVEDLAGTRMSRRAALGLGGLALLAAACGGSTNAGGGGNNGAASQPADALKGKPLEDQLVIYNWSQYDDPSTYKKFEQLPDEAKAGLKIHETYYSSNDELLAKLHAGGTGYDIVVPSQNAVGELIEEGGLMKLDFNLIPNIKNVDPKFLKASYDQTGEYHVIKDFGITMFFWQNTVVKPSTEPKTMKDFYDLLNANVSKGRTNVLDGAEEVVPLASMALGFSANTEDQGELDETKKFLLSIRKGVTTISSFGYINDASAGKIILSQGWNGDVRRILKARQKQGDITAVIPTEKSEVWADNWCVPATAPHPVAAHAWINWLLEPTTAVTEMNYHNYPIPIPAALDQMPASFKNDPMFNVPASYTDNYEYILNPNPQLVNARTKIYQEFKAA
ncbi:MAG TPA: spermidine/putrescine ABC transporter substrate-binding protein [Gaiellales bacterium]|nr:spermidine/putrescine ABC transporter substrate-binding protein [Gaiellales bacterium]